MNEFDDVSYIIMVGGFLNFGIVKEVFWEKFKICCFIILIEFEFVILKGVVYFGYFLNFILWCVVCYIYGV